MFWWFTSGEWDAHRTPPRVPTSVAVAATLVSIDFFIAPVLVAIEIGSFNETD